MYHFHASIHARPEDFQPGQPLEMAGDSFATMQISPEWLGQSALDRSFEEVVADLARLKRMYVEPDGSFVWVSSHGESPWQIDGNLHDHQERLRLADIKGNCPAERFDELLGALGWPRMQLVFQLVRSAVFLDEPEFRRWATLQQGKS
jgi:hypothetical protein